MFDQFFFFFFFGFGSGDQVMGFVLDRGGLAGRDDGWLWWKCPACIAFPRAAAIMMMIYYLNKIPPGEFQMNSY